MERSRRDKVKDEEMTMKEEFRVMQGHEPRNAGSLWKLEKQGTDSLLRPPEGMQPCDTLVSDPF